MQLMADSLQSSMGTLVGSPKLPFFLVVPGAAVLTGLLEAGYYCEWAAGCRSERGLGLQRSLLGGCGAAVAQCQCCSGCLQAALATPHLGSGEQQQAAVVLPSGVD